MALSSAYFPLVRVHHTIEIQEKIMQISGNTILITGGAPALAALLQKLFTLRGTRLSSQAGVKNYSKKQPRRIQG
jgi:hypothetical protein